MAGLDAFGTSLSRGDGAASETFTPIASITGFSPPGISRSTIDVTAHDSPDAWMEFVGNLKDGGEVGVDVNYDPANHDTLLADFEDATPTNYQVAFPEGSVWEFAAILTGFEPDAPHDGKLAASLSWKVTGKPTFITAS